MQELDFIIYNPEIYDSEYRKITIHVTREQLLNHILEAKEKLSIFREEWIETLKIFIKK